MEIASSLATKSGCMEDREAQPDTTSNYSSV